MYFLCLVSISSSSLPLWLAMPHFLQGYGKETCYVLVSNLGPPVHVFRVLATTPHPPIRSSHQLT